MGIIQFENFVGKHVGKCKIIEFYFFNFVGLKRFKALFTFTIFLAYSTSVAF